MRLNPQKSQFHFRGFMFPIANLIGRTLVPTATPFCAARNLCTAYPGDASR